MSDPRPFRPSIEERGIVGDLHTLALIDIRGTVDLMCPPRIDGPSVFAAVLDDEGGRFDVRVNIPDVRHRQSYVSDTSVLVTRFHGTDAVVELTDCMVIGQDAGEPILIRKLESVRGAAKAGHPSGMMRVP